MLGGLAFLVTEQAAVQATLPPASSRFALRSPPSIAVVAGAARRGRTMRPRTTEDTNDISKKESTAKAGLRPPSARPAVFVFVFVCVGGGGRQVLLPNRWSYLHV